MVGPSLFGEETREWKRLFERASFGVVSIGPDLRLRLANAPFACMHGFLVAELEGRPIAELFPVHRRGELEDRLRQANERGYCRWESEGLRKDGSVFPTFVDFSAIRDARGGLLCYAAYVRDVTDTVAFRRLACLVETTDDAITSQSVDGVVLDWNASAERVFGYRSAEIVGRSIRAIIPPERAEERDALAKRALAGEPVIGFETERVKKDGARIPIALTLSPIRDREGRVLGISTIERDISEQKEARALGALLTSLVQSSNDAITAQAFDGTILDWNAGAERIYGYTEAESIGRSISAIVPADREEEREALTKRVLAGEPVIGFETERVRKDGTRVPIALTLSPIRDRDGRIVGLSTVERDITAQKKAQQAEALLASLVQSSSDAILAHALDGTVLDWNGGAEQLYGYAAAEMVGKPVDVIVPEDRIAEREALVQRVLAGESVVGAETERVTKDGRRIAIALTLSPIRDAAGNWRGISTIGRDVTLLKQLERDRAEWSSVVAHELRQPTAVIHMAAEILANRQSEAALERVVERLGRASERLERMIGDLLDVSRIDAHRLSVKPIAIDVAPLVAETVEQLPGLAERCSVEVEPDAGMVLADPERFVQVLSNLLSNACKYGDPGTPIHLSVERAGTMVRTTVTNEGPGISADEISMLFSRFARTRSAQAGTVPGLGLGLYICRGIVEAHGGGLWVESVPGHETHFRFTLPAAVRPEDAQSPTIGVRQALRAARSAATGTSSTRPPARTARRAP